MKKNRKPPERVSTGIPGLDDALSGGLIKDSMYLLDGDPGAGKTTLALQFVLNGAAAGERVLYVTLSETKHELDAVADSHEWDMKDVQFLEILASEEQLRRDAQITMYHPQDTELHDSISLLLEKVEEIKPNRVVIDSLSELKMLAETPLRYRRQVMALKQFFAGRRCTVLLLDDRTIEGTDKQLQSITHGVISLEHSAPLYGRARRKIRVVKLRGSSFSEGFHDFSIVRGGLEVYPRLVASEHQQDFDASHIKSGITALDALLGGGPDRGTNTLLLGPAGSGKSTIAVQYAVAAAERGDHAAIYAFDESVVTLETRTAALGIKLKQATKAGQIMIKQIDPAEMSPGEFASHVRAAVERDHARVVVIDSLNGYLNAMPDERVLVTHLHELLSYLGRRGVTSILVMSQHGLMGSGMHAPVDTSYLADSVVLLRFFEAEGRIKKAISVVKKRSGAHEDSIREMRFDKDGIHLSEPLTQFRGVLNGVPEIISAKSER